MSDLKITTNYHHINLLSGYELSKEEREELDYIAKPDDIDAWMNESLRFFRYRGNIYDTHEFVRVVSMDYVSPSGFEHRTDNPALLKWQGIQTDSFFSGIVYRYVSDKDYEVIQVGLLTC